jgi:hypothetical protein
LNRAEVADLFNLVRNVGYLMETIHGASSSTIGVQDGPDAGQTVPVNTLVLIFVHLACLSLIYVSAFPRPRNAEKAE